MMLEESTISMQLSQAEQFELLEYVPDDAIEFRAPTMADGELGEGGKALTIMVISTTMLSGLCAWLASKGGAFTVVSTLKGLGFEVSFQLTNESKPEDIQAAATKALGGHAVIAPVRNPLPLDRSGLQRTSTPARSSATRGRGSASIPAKPPQRIARIVAGVSLVSTSAAAIYGLYSDKRIAVIAFFGMIFAMVLLLVVARAAREVEAEASGFYDVLVKVLVVFVVGYFMVLTAALFPALKSWLDPEPKSNQVPSNSPGSTSIPGVH